MIKFFRSIRHKLVEKGNLKKYTFYALGEILLVVLGILIALQINNWNNDNKNNKSEAYYLNQIIQDLTTDKKSLTNLKLQLLDQLPKIEKLLEQLHQEFNEEHFKNALQDYMDNVWIPTYFVSHSTTYEEMKSSGKLGLIRDKALRNSIMELYNEIDLLESVVQENMNWLVQVDIDITHHQGMGKFLRVQAPMFSKYITDNDIIALRNKKTDFVNNAATHHWAIKEMTPLAENQIKGINHIIHETEQYTAKTFSR